MQIYWTEKAKKDLNCIEDYIAEDKPAAAIDIILYIIESVELLLHHPALGRPGRALNTRELIISKTPYIVPYRIKQNQIEILRVFHSAMQWPKSFS